MVSILLYKFHISNIISLIEASQLISHIAAPLQLEYTDMIFARIQVTPGIQKNLILGSIQERFDSFPACPHQISSHPSIHAPNTRPGSESDLVSA